MSNEPYTNYNEYLTTDDDGFLTQPVHIPLVYLIPVTVPQTQPLIPQQYNIQQQQQAPIQTQYLTRAEAPPHTQKLSQTHKQPTAPLQETGTIKTDSIYPSIPLDENDEQYILHNIDFCTDTITSIALRYGVNEEDIKRLNKLSDLDLFEGTTLIIPKTDVDTVRSMVNEEELQKITLEKKQRALVAQFSKTYKISLDEARYYLSASNWDYAEAAFEYKEDLHWEKTNNVKKTLEKHYNINNNAKKKGLFNLF